MLGGEVDKMDEQTRGLLCIYEGVARAMLFYGTLKP